MSAEVLADADVTLTDEQGAMAVADLQSYVNVYESLAEALVGWQAMKHWEKLTTQRTHALLFQYRYRNSPEDVLAHLTYEEIKKLENVKSEEEWNDTCTEVKAARGGTYPVDWFRRVILLQLFNRVFEKLYIRLVEKL